MNSYKTGNPKQRRTGERGTAALSAVMIMGLLALFTAASLSRVTTEALVMGNDHSNTRSFYAAQAALEEMSRNFNRVFDRRFNPTPTDITSIETAVPGISHFQFTQQVTQTGTAETRTIEGGPFEGLVSIRDPWRLDATATYESGSEVHLTRNFFNHRVPIFQFGIFYDDDMELHPGPKFSFGGRVHSNRHIFMMAGGGGLDFESRVTAVGEVVRDASRNGLKVGDAGWSWNGTVRIKDNVGVWQSLNFFKGSVIWGPDVNDLPDDMPDGDANTNWATDSQIFGKNLNARVKPLRLPLQVGGNDPIELVKRGRATDDEVLANSRYANKPGIRISLSDRQDRLPGGTGGVRLDGLKDGSAAEPGAGDVRGYLPDPMADGYQATGVNGYRFYTGPSDEGPAGVRQTWIKVEIVDQDPTTLLPVSIGDVTKEFLSLGVTERYRYPAAPAPATINVGDDRAIIKLQRYAIPGPPIKVAAANINNTTNAPVSTKKLDPRYSPPFSDPSGLGGLRDVYTYDSVGSINVVAGSDQGSPAADPAKDNLVVDPKEADPVPNGHGVTVFLPNTVRKRIVPFPIKMYDTREGLYFEDLPATGGPPSWASLYTDGGANSKIPWSGVMTMVDIDMVNLGRFLRGDFDGLFLANATLPGGALTSSLIPDNGTLGTILHVSDRRGDFDNDGEYDMEDVYGPNDGIMQSGEDVNNDGILQFDYDQPNTRRESAPYTDSVETDVAAVFDHRYFRRGVRVVNGGTEFFGPGQPLYTTAGRRGYAIAAENGLYVLGNFNSIGIDPTLPNNPSPSTKYLGVEAPASFAADAVIFLSREWTDAKSFRSPFRHGTRVVSLVGETTVRSALLTGDTRSRLRIVGSPNQGGGDAFLSGGVHNFIRFLEDWSPPSGGNTRLNYCGSLINLFNSRVNNGPHKSGNNTYSPPVRNWVFNAGYLTPTGLPPGTPFFQFVQMTGFRQNQRQER